MIEAAGSRCWRVQKSVRPASGHVCVSTSRRDTNRRLSSTKRDRFLCTLHVNFGALIRRKKIRLIHANIGSEIVYGNGQVSPSWDNGSCGLRNQACNTSGVVACGEIMSRDRFKLFLLRLCIYIYVYIKYSFIMIQIIKRYKFLKIVKVKWHNMYN